MKTKRPESLVEGIASRISESLAAAPGESRYTYTSMRSDPLVADLSGIWNVVSHEIGGAPYERIFARTALREETLEDVDYSATYEFTGSSCVKRVRVSALVRGMPYEYRLGVTLSWRLSGNRMTAHPLSGYQYVTLDGTVYPVSELETSRAPLHIDVTADGERIVLRDGDDVKTLQRRRE